jgi:hypothetical protein
MDGITAGEGSVGESWNFVKTRDDQFKIYYPNQDWEELIIWQMSSGSPAKFGWNLSNDVQNFVVEKMTVIECDVFNAYSSEQETEGDAPEYYDTSALFSCMGIDTGGKVSDVVFNSIVVDTPYLERFIGVRFQAYQGGQYWGNPDADVVFSGLVVNNLSLLAAPPAKSFIYANQGGSAENVIFKNVTVDGEAVSAYDLFPCANFTPGITLADDGLGGTVSKVIFSPRNFSEIAAAGTQYFDIGASTTADRIVLDVYPVDGNTGLPTGVPSVTDYEMQTLDYTLSGGSIQYVGRNGSDYFDGYISNVKIYNGSDLLIDSPLDEDWTVNAKARNRAAVIAVDSGTAPTTTNSPWVSNGDGTYSIDGSQGGNTNLYYQNVFTLDNVYLLIITVSGSTAGGVRPYSSDINSETVTSGNGTFEFEFTPSSNDDINIQADSDFDGTVTFTIADVTDAPAYLTAVNIDSDDAEVFEFDSDYGWVSVQNYFGPTTSFGWNLADGEYTKSENSWGALGETFNNGTVPAGVYKVTYSMSDEIGSMALFTRNAANNDNDFQDIDDGEGVVILLSVPTGGIWFNSNNSAGTVLKDISFKELLAIAE